MKKDEVIEFLDRAQSHADDTSGCVKVAVGCVIVQPKSSKQSIHEIYGVNRTIPKSCKVSGCHRVELYGEDSKEHRLPSDCRAVHAEIDAIATAARFGIQISRSTIIITRYPCEACARAIVTAGIKHVYYGRGQAISQETERIFDEGNVKVTHVDDWRYIDVER